MKLLTGVLGRGTAVVLFAITALVVRYAPHKSHTTRAG